MIRKSLGMISVVAASLFAVDMDFHGNITTEVGTDLPVENFDPTYFAENDLRLIGSIQLNDGVSFDVTLHNYSSVGIDRSDLITTDRGYENYGYLTDDTSSSALNKHIHRRTVDKNALPVQLLAKWNFTKNGTLMLGDFTYSAGKTNLSRASDSLKFASIFREQSLRGFGIKASGATVYTGIIDSAQSSMGIYASYDVDIINKPKTKFSVKPVVDWVMLGDGTKSQLLSVNPGANGTSPDTNVIEVSGRNREWNMGVEYAYSSYVSSMEYSISGAFGLLPYAGENTYTMLIEPSINIAKFSFGMGAYYAALADDGELSYMQTDMPEQYFLYMEPTFELHPKITVGLLYEYHDQSFKTDKDMMQVITPAFYLYPNDALEIRAMAGMTLNETFDEGHFALTMQSAVRF